MPTNQSITHIIYDLDGLLLDTESIHAHVNQIIAARYDKVYDITLQSQVIGRKAPDSAQIIIDALSLPVTVADYLAQKDALIYELYPTAKPMPGAVELTRHFYQQGIPQAIASSSAQKPFQAKTLHHQEWLTLFDCLVLGDDPAVQKGKPFPDCFLHTAKQLGAAPEQCLVFEDSLAGVAAAKQAGMSVVAVPARHLDKRLFHEADAILDSLTEFQPQFWQLPPLTQPLLSGW